MPSERSSQPAAPPATPGAAAPPASAPSASGGVSGGAPAGHVQLSARIREAARRLEESFVDKAELARLLLISAIAGEHLLIVGPPGTAKSAMVRAFARLIDARYFEYLLTRFTEPNEIFGPVDIAAFRQGTYQRKTETMLPEAEIVFLDEVFKSNSAILNSLLTVLNERKFNNGSRIVDVPVLSVFGATNEVPNDEALDAIFDRFLVRVVSSNLDSYHFHNLVTRGLRHEGAKLAGHDRVGVSEERLFSTQDLRGLQRQFDRYLRVPEEFLSRYKGLIFQIRSEGITVSDRRVVKLVKLFVASAIFDGRDRVHDGDFFILKHIWNNLDQVELLEEIVGPVVDKFYQDHPDERRAQVSGVGLDELLAELRTIRDLLTSGEPLSDVQLFSQLKNLNEIKAALQARGGETARRMVEQVDQLLEHVLASSKFA